jgi:hypothetical protein
MTSAVQSMPPANTNAPHDTEEKKAREPKQATLVIQTIGALAELFHDPEQDAYATVTVAKRSTTMKLTGRAFRTWVAHTVHDALGYSVGGAAIDEAITVLAGHAIHKGEERAVHVRVAEHDGSIYLDLGDESGEAVHVTSRGWEVLSLPPVRFLRSRAMRPLPRPVQAGSILELRPFVNVADDHAFVLLVAWLVAALRPGRPCPILALHGEQGTGKSTASRVARSLVDPSAAMVRSVPRGEDDLLVTARRSHVLAYDNLSGVQPWLSDALCRVVTGGGLSKRALYTDDDEVVIEAMRPVIINGIDDLANRADLAERCIVLALEPITKRRDEGVFWSDFDRATPRILGALLDGVASALATQKSVQIDDLPRMADFARWATAAESGLGLERGDVMAAYRANMAKAVDVALEASPVACAVRELLARPEHAGHWEGTPKGLLDTLGRMVTEDVRRSRTWPRLPNILTGQLRRYATFLRRVEVSVTPGYQGKSKWLVLRMGEECKPATASTERRSQPETSADVPSVPARSIDEGSTAGDSADNHRRSPTDGEQRDRRRADPERTSVTVDAVDAVDDPRATQEEGFADYLEGEGIARPWWQ